MKRLILALACAALWACSPPQGAAPDAADAALEIVVESPAADARVETPLMARGTAPNNWYFEAVFVARLETPAGELIADAPASAQTDWMVEGPVPFLAEIHFDVAAETPAVLVLQEDMPPEDAAPREVRIPVTLLPIAGR